MIRWRMANIIKRLARHRDDMRLANFQRVRGLDAEWKLLTFSKPNTVCRTLGQPELSRGLAVF